MSHLATVAGSQCEVDSVDFCSYCGRLGEDDQRVCSECGLGVRLTTSARVMRAGGAAFLVVRGNGRVSAASAAAEQILSRHGSLVGKPIAALMAVRGTGDGLDRAVAQAASGDPSAERLEVGLLRTGGRRAGAHVTVTACGSPTAALVLIERA